MVQSSALSAGRVPAQIAADIDANVSALLSVADKAAADTGAELPTNFALDLFGRVPAEDLAYYTPEELARLAIDAYAHLRERTPNIPKIRFATPESTPADDRLHGVSVLEIVNDDMPFLVDSVMGELTEHGLTPRLVAHPVLTIARDHDGRLLDFAGTTPPGPGMTRESFIHIHVERVDDAARRYEIVRGLEHVLADVRVAVADWRAMTARVREIVASLKSDPPLLPVDEIAEAVQFLEWLLANNFTFLGVRDYVFTGDDRVLEPQFETGLGVLRRQDLRVLWGKGAPQIDADIRAVLTDKKPLIIAKAGSRSRVHRRIHMDYVGVRRFDAEGKLLGEVRILGLFTSTAYTSPTRFIPYLRRKIDAVVRRAGFDPDSHSGKALVNVLETYPRDELFQLDETLLLRFALTVQQLDERPRVRVLARRDRFDRFVSVMVFVPRDRYDSNVRARIGSVLAQAFHGHVSAFHPFFPEGPLVRVHFIIARREGAAPEPARDTLEAEVEAQTRTWSDNLIEALAAARAPDRARELIERYRQAFSAGYRDVYSPEAAIADIRVIENLTQDCPFGVDFHPRRQDEPSAVGLKIWSHRRPIPLSERVPVLENMGFRVVDERTYHIEPAGQSAVWFHDMVLQRADGAPVDLPAVKSRLESCFLVVMAGGAESDGYNALVLTGGLMWRQVALIRALSRYLRQLRVPFSQDYMWTTLRKHAGAAALIVRLFEQRFDPRLAGDLAERGRREAATFAEIESALDKVDSLDEDRIIRHFVAAVRAAVRTNFFQIDGGGRVKSQIAVKFASRQLDLVPLPRPLYEIFVYSPRVEGVHLRFGKVARGGIRWSDRPQDFRTEILGLVKAQQVKNAVIVPVGAKGGFVPKHLPAIVASGAGREAIQAEGVAAYKLFIGTLLDITDNLGPDGLIPPDGVVRHEGDDPYLVVAADKGTATFSDIANEISTDHGYWLGDAFASGGSAGYDHKKMGITARGAWESVKRHFREMDVDIGRAAFTCVGVGDMSGDVFGNGMLRETTTRLVAAFDHRDIFIDPTPDPEKSFAERARLFALPRSSWQDYDKSLISPGGGVFSRGSKEITLSPQAQAALGLTQESATPQQVMQAILKAPVDLLFFGGIGTYVRAAQESDEEVGDRANDAIRIVASALRCKVIGEGANLGMTQRGRIEAGQNGVRLNTDAIDNSAGVNTSDIEVNIKIALSRPRMDGRLTLEARDTLLASLTDQVAALVLRNNYQQTLALSLAERRGLADLGFQQRLMQVLETSGELDRTVEALPDEITLDERRHRGRGLTRPELAVLLAYAKLSLNHDLLESSVPDDRYLGRELQRYFPGAIAERFPDALEHHRLRREIIATQLTNSMINRGGPSFVVRIADQTGASVAAIAAAFAAVRGSYGLIALHNEIDALDNKVAGALQLDLYAAVQDLLLDRIVWFLRNVDLTRGLEEIIAHYQAGVGAVEDALDRVLSADAGAARMARVGALTGGGVPESLARCIANLPALTAAPDITLVAARSGKPVAEVAATYFAAGSYFRLDRVIDAAQDIKVTDYFDRLALDRALDSIGDAERRLTGAMMANGAADAPGPATVETWVAAHRDEVDRVRMAIHEIAGTGLTLSKLSVTASLLGDLVKP